MITAVSLFLCSLVAVIAVVRGNRWKGAKTQDKIIFIILVSAPIVNLASHVEQYTKDKKLKRVVAKIGTITGSKDYIIPTIGMFGKGLTFTNSKFLNVGEHLLSCNIVGDKINVNMALYDKDGSPIAVIEDNEWTLYSDDFEYQNNETAFELVTKGARNVFIQLDISTGILNIRGILYGPRGGGFYFGNDGSLLSIGRKQYDSVIHNNIKKMFKYPRGSHFGELTAP